MLLFLCCVLKANIIQHNTQYTGFLDLVIVAVWFN